MFRAKLILIFIIIICSYVYFSKPTDVVINEKGKVIGLVNKARALLQGYKFYKFQFDLANERYKANLSPSESFTVIMKEIELDLQGIDEAINEAMEGYYTPEEKKANSLRREADRIEKEGFRRRLDEMLEKDRLRTIEKLKLIIPIIKEKLMVAKHSHTPIFLVTCVIIFTLLVIITRVRKVKSP